MKNLIRLLACLASACLLSVAVAAQGDSTLHKVRGFLPDLKFSLQGAGNKTVTEENFDDKIVLMFFGYASCPDVCPTTMAQLAQVMEELGDDAAKVRILFVSVDPHRDTPDVLQSYVDAFDSHAIGLTGTEKQVADVARRYRVAYQIEKPKGDDTANYEVSHSRGVYVFDDAGRARYLAADTDAVDVLLAGVRELLAEG
ncbi:SCO family protein [Pollutimonas thiosulfatoxidans]|uniref:SCO family protein n=1 Tax=Pollutimonas thiosulfatoxidans TaxID=2028345 RepID=A0A410GB04_9BURK|nr:SCO family protein [Pollutimonas thiosulfatoxidans]MBF6616289.1 SCO family protein [Candidimonas sp.]NYT45947.1 SCO family protein [Alcaligenaceae bacterium]QAA93471.1 SCO family protein [Pollutimonas thiosulfatoxidans]